MEIALLRHGKPAAISNVPVSASQFGNWIASYNSAGVERGSVIPQASLEYARTCGVVVTSNLLRSVQSAKFLHVENYQAPDKLFAEAGMPYATWVTFKLPPKYWAVLFRVLWYLGYSKNSESYREARKRSVLAVRQLVDLAESHQSVLLVGHGIFNRLVAQELKGLGWIGPDNPGSKYWAFRTYSKLPDNTGNG